VRIGVISDTHVPDLSPVLSARIAAVFRGLDIILHVGDITELYVLEEFQDTYTLTFAVSGEGDSEQVQRYLDERRVVRFGGRRVGMIHGHQFENAHKGVIAWMRRFLGGASDAEGLPGFLLEQFAKEDADAIVYGHTHQPYIRDHDGVLLVNPGSAVPMPGHRPSVGLLNVQRASITCRIVYL
jgi:putative phosphoesterase